jgi:phage protein U
VEAEKFTVGFRAVAKELEPGGSQKNRSRLKSGSGDYRNRFFSLIQASQRIQAKRGLLLRRGFARTQEFSLEVSAIL